MDIHIPINHANSGQHFWCHTPPYHETYWVLHNMCNAIDIKYSHPHLTLRWLFSFLWFATNTNKNIFPQALYSEYSSLGYKSSLGVFYAITTKQGNFGFIKPKYTIPLFFWAINISFRPVLSFQLLVERCKELISWNSSI